MDICRVRRVLFWRGCTLRRIVPELAFKIGQVLEKTGINVEVVDEGICCGYPLILAGYERKFSEVASKVVEKVKNTRYELMIVHCPGCLRAFKQFYPQFGFELSNIFHTTQVFAQLLNSGVLKPEKRIELKVTYHDPCDLGRHLGIYEEPRKILSLIPGVIFIELPEVSTREYSRCCGGGGLLRMLIPPLSSQIAVDRLIEDIAELNVQAVVTACPTCFKTINDASVIAEILHGSAVKVLDIVDLVYDTTR